MNNASGYKRSHICLLVFLVAVCINSQLLSIVTGYKIIDVHFGNINFGIAAVGVIFFPLIYTCEDVITELFGSKIAKFVVWMTLFSILIFCLAIKFAVHLIPNHDWLEQQQEYQNVLSHTWRMGCATLFGLPISEFINVFILAKWKALWKGRFYFIRSSCSTCIGEFIDTTIAYLVAFYGSIPILTLIKLLMMAYLLKIIYTIFSAAVVAPIVQIIKVKMQLDTYDKKIYFNPFNLR